MTAASPGFARLLTWLSPAFPVGSFSYSHGLEWAVEAGWVSDRASLQAWITDVLTRGSGRSDAILLACAWAAERAQDNAALAEIAAWGAAFRSTSELALESEAQGRAFLAAVRAAWPHPRLDAFAAGLAADRRPPAYPVAVGVAAAAFGIAADPTCLAFVQAFAANLVGAGVKLIPLGQTDGLRVLAALETTVAAVSAATGQASLADLGTATWRLELASGRHETQYTRLFRS